MFGYKSRSYMIQKNVGYVDIQNIKSNIDIIKIYRFIIIS